MGWYANTTMPQVRPAVFEMTDDTELFAIEAWMRQQGLTGENEAERERMAKQILLKIRLERVGEMQQTYYSDTVMPRGLFANDPND